MSSSESNPSGVTKTNTFIGWDHIKLSGKSHTARLKNYIINNITSSPFLEGTILFYGGLKRWDPTVSSAEPIGKTDYLIKGLSSICSPGWNF